MPASHLSYKELTEKKLPVAIYLDTSFWVALLVDGKKYHKEAVDFMDRLEKNDVVIMTSLITIAELKCAILKICIESNIMSNTEKEQKTTWATKKIKDNPELISQFHPEIKKAKENFDAIWNRFMYRDFIILDEKIISVLGDTMAKYRLASYDAIHVASMEFAGIKDIAVFDKDIENLPHYKNDCNVWTVNGLARYKRRQSTLFN